MRSRLATAIPKRFQIIIVFQVPATERGLGRPKGFDNKDPVMGGSIRCWCAALFLVLLSGWLPVYADSSPRILVIHSHDSAYVWTRDLTAGFVERITEFAPEASVAIEYLDARRVEFSTLKLPFLAFLEAKYSDPPDLIVAFDNDALNFLREESPAFAEGVPLVFAGINNFHERLLDGLLWRAGVREDLDVLGTARLARRLDPMLEKMLVVTDTNPSGKLVLSELERKIQDDDAGFEWEYFADWSLDELEARLKTIDQTTGILTISITFPDGQRPIPRDEAVEFIRSRTSAPVFALLADQIESGFVGGSVVEGVEMGRQTGEISADVLSGALKERKIYNTEHTLLLNYEAMDDVGIATSAIPEQAVVLNRPTSVLEEYRDHLLAGLFFIVVQAVVIALLVANIVARRRAQEALLTQASTDELTGLSNRRTLQELLRHALALSRRTGHNGALIYLDLDEFKTINDTRGHNIGDDLLVEVAQRLRKSARESDLVARLGGDEFVVVLEDLSGSLEYAAVQARAVGEKIRCALELPYEMATGEYRSSASLGIVLFTGQEDSAELLLRHADLAMYKAKDSGRNTLRFFDPEMQKALNERTELECELRSALDEGQFVPYYQPQLDQDGRVIGTEVLLRWQHPQRGMVSPAQFIPVAEATGLIVPIGQWILEKACLQIKAWSDVEHLRHLRVSVNVSAMEFRHPQFLEQVKAILAKSGADPARLRLELTESAVLDDLTGTFEKMQTLKQFGVGFALDDFGTGHSSLAYLTRLPLDTLKIDSSFVFKLPDSHNDAVVAQTIISMARSLGLNVIAEGVETEAQRDFLAAHQCYEYQGFFYSRPVPLDEFQAYTASMPSELGYSTGF